MHTKLVRFMAGTPAHMKLRWASSRVLQAAVWSTIFFAVGQILRFASNIVISRLLSPEMFGVMAIVMIIQSALVMACDIGLLPLVMRSERAENSDFLNTLWTVQILRGFAIFGLGILASALLFTGQQFDWFPVGSALRDARLPLVLVVTLFTAVIVGLQSTSILLAYRRMDLRILSIVELTAQVAGIVAMIAVSWVTRSIWGLVAASIVSSAVNAVLSHTSMPGAPNRLAWDRSTLTEISRSGRWVALASVASIAALNADRIFMSGTVDATQLGLYTIALNIVFLIDLVGQRLVGAVVQPDLSDVARRDVSAVAARLLRYRWLSDSGFLFMAGWLYSIAPTLVATIFDSRYAGAGFALQILSCLLIFYRYQIFGAAYMAIGRPALFAKVNTIRLISLVVLLPLGYQLSGFNGILLAVAIHMVPSILYIYHTNIKLGFNSLFLEISVLAFWFLGYIVGGAMQHAISPLLRG